MCWSKRCDQFMLVYYDNAKYNKKNCCLIAQNKVWGENTEKINCRKEKPNPSPDTKWLLYKVKRFGSFVMLIYSCVVLKILKFYFTDILLE